MNAVEFSRQVREQVILNLDNENYFDQEVMFSEFGKFAFEGRIKGNVEIYEDREVNYFDAEVKRFELEIESVYNEDGEVLDLTQYELTLIEKNLRDNIDFDFNRN